MEPQTLTHGKIKVTIRERTGFDRLLRYSLVRKLGVDEKEAEGISEEERDLRNAKINFCWLAPMCEIEGVKGWKKPTTGSMPKEVEQAFTHWWGMPDSLLEDIEAAATIMERLGDMETLPPETQPKEVANSPK